MGSGAFSLYNLHYAETQDKKGESTCCGLPLEARQHDKSPSTRYDLQQAFLVVYLHIITQHGLFFFFLPSIKGRIAWGSFVCLYSNFTSSFSNAYVGGKKCPFCVGKSNVGVFIVCNNLEAYAQLTFILFLPTSQKDKAVLSLEVSLPKVLRSVLFVCILYSIVLYIFIK